MSSTMLASDLHEDSILSTLIDQVKQMTQDWFDGESVDIDADTRLVQDVGFSSMDFVMLVVDIQQALGRRNLPFDDLFAPGGEYVTDLTPRQIASFLFDHLAR